MQLTRFIGITRFYRTSIFIIFFIALCGAGRAFASCPPDSGRVVSGGIKVEANAFAYLMTGVSPQVAKTTPGAGVSIGGFVFFNIHKHFALQIDVLYHFKQAYTEQHGIKANLRYLSVEIPFYVMGQWRFKDCSRLFVGTGPDVDFGYYAVLESNGEKFDLYKKDDDTELSAMQNNSMGWVVMAGYEFPFGLQLNIAYKGAFYNVLDANRTEVGAYPYTLSIGAAYRFGLTAPKRKGGGDVD